MKKRFLLCFFTLLLASCVICSNVYATSIDDIETEETVQEESEIDATTDTSSEEGEGEASGIEIQEGYDTSTEWLEKQKGVGYATFIADVDPTIHETLYVQIMNESTYKEYAYYLYEINAYSTRAPLPTGYYIITAGGIPTDTAGIYPIQNVEFEIQEGYNTTVNFTIGHNNSIFNTVETEGEKNIPQEMNEDNSNVEIFNQDTMKQQNYTESTEDIDNQNAGKKKSNPTKDVMSFIKHELWVGILILIIGGIYIYKRKKEEEED